MITIRLSTPSVRLFSQPKLTIGKTRPVLGLGTRSVLHSFFLFAPGNSCPVLRDWIHLTSSLDDTSHPTLSIWNDKTQVQFAVAHVQADPVFVR